MFWLQDAEDSFHILVRWPDCRRLDEIRIEVVVDVIIVVVAAAAAVGVPARRESWRGRFPRTREDRRCDPRDVRRLGADRRIGSRTKLLKKIIMKLEEK